MKIQKYLVFTSLFLSCLVTSFIHSETNYSTLNKMYLNYKTVKVTKKGFLIITKNGPAHVTTLRSDKNGIFILEQDLSAKEKKMYTCSYCPRMFYSESAVRRHEAYCELNPDN